MTEGQAMMTTGTRTVNGRRYLPVGSKPTKNQGVLGGDGKPAQESLKRQGIEPAKTQKAAGAGGTISKAEFDKMTPAQRSIAAAERLGFKPKNATDAAEQLAYVSEAMSVGAGVTPQKAARSVQRQIAKTGEYESPNRKIFSGSELSEIKQTSPRLYESTMRTATEQRFTGSDRVKFAKADSFLRSKDRGMKGNRDAAEAIIVQPRGYTNPPTARITSAVLLGGKVDMRDQLIDTQ